MVGGKWVGLILVGRTDAFDCVSVCVCVKIVSISLNNGWDVCVCGAYLSGMCLDSYRMCVCVFYAWGAIVRAVD